MRSIPLAALGASLVAFLFHGPASGADAQTVQQAEVKMLRSSVERLSKENGELKKQVAELKGKLDAKPAVAPAKSQRVLFVVDGSGSMLSRLDVAQKIVRDAVKSLPPNQAFNVVLAAEHARCFRGAPVPATEENKSAASALIDQTTARGAADVLTAVQIAFDQQPDVVYLITDGDVQKTEKLAEAMAKMNAGKAKVNTTVACCASDNVAGMKALWRLAQETGGVCTNDQGIPLTSEPTGAGSLFK